MHRYVAVVAVIGSLSFTPAKAEITTSLIEQTLNVGPEHVSVKHYRNFVEVYYSPRGCATGAEAARKSFADDLVKLLPVLLKNDQTINIFHVHGGCVYGNQDGTDMRFDDHAISASFKRDALADVDFHNVTGSYLFEQVSFGRFMNPDMR